MAQDTTSYYQFAGKFVTIKLMTGEILEGQVLEVDKDRIGLLTEKDEMKFVNRNEIAEITELHKIGSGNNPEDEMYPTRYVGTPGYLSMEKGDNYGRISFFGPEIQYAAAKNLTIGMMMSWLGAPMGFTGKYSFPLGKKVHMGFGCLFGWGGIVLPTGFAVIPFGGLTFGDAGMNLSLSGGYGITSYQSDFSSRQIAEQPAFAIAAMRKANDGSTFVIESLLIPSVAGNRSMNFSITPAIRFHRKNTRSMQAGITLLMIEGRVVTYPIPSISWLFKCF